MWGITSFDLTWREQSPPGLHDAAESGLGFLVPDEWLAGVVAASVAVLPGGDVQVDHQSVEGQDLLGVGVAVALAVVVPRVPRDDIGLVASLADIILVGVLEVYELLLSEKAYPQQSLFELVELDAVLEVVNLGLVLDKLAVDVVSLLERRDRLTLDVLLQSLLTVGTFPLVRTVLKEQNICDPEVLDEQLELLHEEPVWVVGERDVFVDLLDVEVVECLDRVVVLLVGLHHCLVLFHGFLLYGPLLFCILILDG